MMACRAAASASLAGIPSKEQPTYEDLDGYKSTHAPVPDIAYSDRYIELCAWLNDHEARRRQKDRDEIPESQKGNSLSQFDYHRG
jgi:hypothetical protein